MLEEAGQAALGVRQQGRAAMKIDQSGIMKFEADVAAAFDDRGLNCYAIIDSAQDGTLLARFAKAALSTRSMCLLPAAIESGVEEYSPHLVALSPLAADSDAWPEFIVGGSQQPASFTLLASSLDFDELWSSLSSFTEIVLPDNTEMIFAFWDPAVLGTLIGQASDATLHVPGPVLSERQRARLMKGISAWWYWDRNGAPQRVLPVISLEAALAYLVGLPLRLTQIQIDMLVEAGMPDQLLSLVNENQPLLLRDIPIHQQYGRMAKHLVEARRLTLFGMRDILNYTCAALIYGEAMYVDGEIKLLLERVKTGEIDFDSATKLFPGHEEAEW
jgi:hypothetical protein